MTATRSSIAGQTGQAGQNRAHSSPMMACEGMHGQDDDPPLLLLVLSWPSLLLSFCLLALSLPLSLSHSLFLSLFSFLPRLSLSDPFRRIFILQCLSVLHNCILLLHTPSLPLPFLDRPSTRFSFFLTE